MYHTKRLCSFLVLFLLAAASTATAADPPYAGTVHEISPDIITDADDTTFSGPLTYAGQGNRMMFDRRIGDDGEFVEYNAFLFTATFTDAPSVEVQVNPEFGDEATAEAAAEQYLPAIGRIPRVLREDLETVWIHQGTYPFGGGNRNLLIHTGQGDLYVADGILEETFVHEACHTSLDARHANAPKWIAAQNADGMFISTYARDNPAREDVAESFLPFWAVEYRSERLSQLDIDTINATIPNRMSYFRNCVMKPCIAPPEQVSPSNTFLKRKLKRKLKKARKKLRIAKRKRQVGKIRLLKRKVKRFRRKIRSL